jgi:ABC-type sulfate/molybdate transport systems ATPase subunit
MAMVRTGEALSVESLSVAAGDFRLSEVSFDLPAGACVIIAGPSGSGKTVLLETLAGLRSPMAGRIRLGRRDLAGVDPAARGIGYLPQDHALFPFLNVFDNVAFGLRVRGCPPAETAERVREVLALLQIEPLAARSIATLSGGERQRVALARAMAIRPGLLLLDEPLSALDEETAAEIRRCLRDLRRRYAVTTLHVCHSMEEALALGDRILFLRQGRLVQEGTPAELLATPAEESVIRFFRLDTVLTGEIRPATEDGPPLFWWNGRAIAPMAGERTGAARVFIVPDAVRLSLQPPSGGPEAAVGPAVYWPLPEGLGRIRLQFEGGGEWTVPCRVSDVEAPPGTPVWAVFPQEAMRRIGNLADPNCGGGPVFRSGRR